MSNYPKLHHYVPQFYLARFINENRKLWIWDKTTDRCFETTPGGIAAERHFYRIPDLPDPLAMEKQLSDVEGNASLITEQWLYWLHEAAPFTKIDVPNINRSEMALYLTTQYLRTADQRQILSLLSQGASTDALDATAKRDLHTKLLWDDATIDAFKGRFYEAIWIFARNDTAVPLVTSDNPVIFKTPNKRMWIKMGALSEGTYSVFPLSPEIAMYCYDRNYPAYANLKKFDCTLSPVALTDGMVEQENTGQTFAASRFVISRSSDFAALREFATTIGTDRYAPKS